MWFNLQNASDTIYACRSGIVCDNSLSDTSNKGSERIDRSNQITIYHHADGTLADYTFAKGTFTALVAAGKYVKTGDPIAVVKGQRVPDPKDKTKTRVSRLIAVGIYFLDKNKVHNDQTGSKHTHFVPMFHTTEGDLKLQSDVTYRCHINDQIATADMSRSEKNCYLKNKAK